MNSRLRQFLRRGMMGSNGRRFYVDATGGNDSYDGLSPANAWKTIPKVNSYAGFRFGDSVLLKRGEIWDVSAISVGLAPSTHGLTFDAYGSGALPILDGGSVSASGFTTNSKNYITIRNLDIRNANFPLTISASSWVVVVGVDVSGANMDGILCTGGANHVSLYNITSHDHPGSGGTDTCFEAKDDSHDILVDGFTFSNSRYGFSIHNHVPAQDNGIMPYNITIRNGTISNASIRGMQVNKQDANIDTDRKIIIENVTVNGVTSMGIYVGEAAGASTLNGVIFRNCFIDLAGTANQYGMNIFGTARFENCVFASSWPACVVDTKGNLEAYNCDFYRNASSTFQVKNSPVSTLLRNCIIYTTGTTIIDFQSITGIEDLDYNLYYAEGANPVTGTLYRWNGTAYTWANWLINSGQDANSPTPANPNFVTPGSDFHLQAGSPAIDAGVDVGLAYLGVAPDCGAFEKA